MPQTLRVLVAPGSFKGVLTAREAAEALGRGLAGLARVESCPVADGGEGTLDALVAAAGGRIETHTVTGPLGAPVKGRLGFLEGDGTGVIEMAEAAGLGLVPRNRRDPTRTRTHGVGELIRKALDRGVRRLLVGVGGSATCDGGAGMAEALGVRFVGLGAGEVAGGLLGRIEAIDTTGLDPRLGTIGIEVACDVSNPLRGAEGAAAVFAPQKGATPEQVAELERGLAHLARKVGEVPLPSPADQAGAGSAGGLGYGLAAFCGARLRAGGPLVLEALGFAARVARADLVLTGEGRLDAQTLRGKTVAAVAAQAGLRGVACVAVAGAVDAGVERELGGAGLTAAFALAEGPVSARVSRARTAELLERAASRIVRVFAAGRAPRSAARRDAERR